MEYQETSSLKSLHTPIETATTFVFSIEGELVLLFEDVGISLALFAGTSNYGDSNNDSQFVISFNSIIKCMNKSCVACTNHFLWFFRRILISPSNILVHAVSAIYIDQGF